MNLEEKGKKAFNIHKQIEAREIKRRELFAQNVLDLVQMHDEKLYEPILGFDPPPKWSGYLGLIELFYSRSQVERWRKIINKLVKDWDIEPKVFITIPETRLEDIANLIQDKKEGLELLAQAGTVTAMDWRRIVQELKGEPTSDTCKHGYEVYRICKKCGDKIHQDIRMK